MASKLDKGKFKVINGSKKTKLPVEKKRESTEERLNITDEEIYYNQKVDGLGAHFTVGEILVEDIQVMIGKQGSEIEIENWQEFKESWNKLINSFEEFWVSCDYKPE